MDKLAIFIDGGYIKHLAEHQYKIWIDYEKFSTEILREVNNKTPYLLDILRTYFYDSLPYQSNPPSDYEKEKFSKTRRLFDTLNRLPRFKVREGRTEYRGTDATGDKIFQQKRVDIMLGLDIALLSGKRLINHLAIVSGDSDLIPAITLAKEEGISTWLFHGPRSDKNGYCSYAKDLWQECDERFEMTQSFVEKCTLVRNNSKPTYK